MLWQQMKQMTENNTALLQYLLNFPQLTM